MVTTREGMPDDRDHQTVEQPGQHADAERRDDGELTLPVACQTQTKPTMPRAMIDGKDRSMSPAMMTMRQRHRDDREVGRRLGEREVDRGPTGTFAGASTMNSAATAAGTRR